MVKRLRTAVLVVHGMGSQRPLETVRGVINALWFDNDDHDADKVHKLWSHPEPSGVDLDLTVMTTNDIPGTKPSRVADFHELYWAHHLSETKAVAVLLWLFELGRRGPRFDTGMNGLWWVGAVYLSLMLLSSFQLLLSGVIWVSNIAQSPYQFVVVLALMLFVGLLASVAAAIVYRYWLLTAALAAVIAALAVLSHFALPAFHAGPHGSLATWTNACFAPALALVAAFVLMGRWGVLSFAATYLLSWLFFVFAIYLTSEAFTCSSVWVSASSGDVPWALTSDWSKVAAWTVLLVYVAADAAFLQPYLGDAARYFRNSPANVRGRRAIRKDAVDTLDQLHRCRDYDRIVVVAHSLGTAVAYDMMRAYYSRVCGQIPVRPELEPELSRADTGDIGCGEMRRLGRALIAKLAQHSAVLDPAARTGNYRPAESGQVDAWLVTDFVTLGSPLTHAKYLMTAQKNGDALDATFASAVREREFPTCPPQQLYGDGRLTYTDHNTNLKQLHHGGVFGLTRWTNLFFPVTNIFWGDAIGGPVSSVFGKCAIDRKVFTKRSGRTAFFSHVSYWKTDCKPDRRLAPHLEELADAVDLADTGDVNTIPHS
jgi:hypothetical protein